LDELLGPVYLNFECKASGTNCWLLIRLLEELAIARVVDTVDGVAMLSAVALDPFKSM
jgi:hypothetical protein